MLSLLECLGHNKCSVCMIENYVSPIKANFILYDLQYTVFQQPKIKYFIKALRINRPLSLRPYNIISIARLSQISAACEGMTSRVVYRAVFLKGVFAFLRLTNLAPQAIAGFDPTRHLTGEDNIFTKKFVKVFIKWGKTMQDRDQVQCVTLPKLQQPLICPYRAVKAVFGLYPVSATTSLFQIQASSGFIPLTDSRVRKTLKSINMVLGLNPSFHTFHDFCRSGATFSYTSQSKK